MPAPIPAERSAVERAEQAARRDRFWKRFVVGVGVAVVCVQFVRLCIKPKGDFDVHWESGRRLLAGEPLYARAAGGDVMGHNHPYPPFWALAHAPLSLLPVQPAQLLVYPLLAVSLAVLMRTLRRLTEVCWPLPERAEFWVAALAVFLASRYLVRDMPECGVNLALVALSWLAVLCWTRRREWAGGVLLGLAMSLKCTPALFWAWFLWKRQWKMAATTAAASAVFTLSPALVMGPAEYAGVMTEWVGNAGRGLSSGNPADGVLGDEPLQNMSLRPALARYLMHLPPGHRSRVDHSLYADFLDLPPAVAGWAAKLTLAGLVVVAAWTFRAPVRDRRDPALLWECAAVSVLILLLSPITWGQHCVGVLPVCYLVARTTRFARSEGARPALPRWALAAVGCYVLCVLVLNRTLLGQEWTYLLDSYRAATGCLVALVAVAFAGRRACAGGAVVEAAAPATSRGRGEALPAAG